MTTDLYSLSIPFPQRMVHENPSGGGSYVRHSGYTQRLLLHAFPYDFELVQIIRGWVAGKAPNPNGSSKRAKEGTPDLDDAVVGVVMRLRCQIDGRTVTIEEAGDCEDPHNWPHDGARLKDAMSDALKRCCMRVGLGLHLYAQDEYVLRLKLAERGQGPDDGSADEPKAAA